MNLHSQSAAGTSVVSLHGVSRRFPPNTVALEDAHLRVRAGESVALRGASGSGKTTLLALLGLLDRPTTGSYELLGTETVSMSERDRTQARRQALAFVFQAFHLIPHLTVLENVRLGIQGPSQLDRESDLDDRARAALDHVRLSHRLTAFPPTLSGGEQQRVAVARALVRRPMLLLCDEPTGNLDSQSADAVLRSILGATERGAAVIVATHDDEVARRCAREVHLRDGRLQEQR